MRHAPCSLSNLSLAYQETTHPNGAIGGLQVGHNWQSTPNWIFGIEADIQASGEGASGNAQQSGPQTLVAASIACVPSCGNPRSSTSISQSISQNGSLLWFGTVRGRIGYAIWPTVMLYGTGGLAYGRLNESPTPPSCSSLPSLSSVGGLLVTEYLRAGWAIKILLAVISFGFFVLYGAGLFMAIYEPSARNGEPSFWAPFTGLFLISTFLLLRRPVGRASG
jgi:hypothetical protein